jgi:HAD superfamily hydrolase (TIGR01509 family)
MATPTLLFDVMDTLVRDPFFAVAPVFFDMTLEELFAAKDPAAWVAFERGAIDEATLGRRYFRDRRAFDIAGLREAIAAAWAPLPGIISLLEELRGGGQRVHALSNYPIWYVELDARLGLGRYLEWSFVSCDTGRRKPEADAYLEAAAALGVAATGCLFVDDREANCAAAAAVGMRTHCFSGAARLRAALVEAGVLDA